MLWINNRLEHACFKNLLLILEIPLYRVITAQVTFDNIHGVFQPVKNVTTMSSTSMSNPKDVKCIVDESVFTVPPSYKTLGSNLMPHNVQVDEEDILLQLAIQQSLASVTDPNAIDQVNKFCKKEETK